jgi:hypothetical protein
MYKVPEREEFNQAAFDKYYSEQYIVTSAIEYYDVLKNERLLLVWNPKRVPTRDERVEFNGLTAKVWSIETSYADPETQMEMYKIYLIDVHEYE